MLISGHQSNEWCLVSADSNYTWEDIQLLSFKSELTFSQAPQCQCLVLSWKGRLLPHQVRFTCFDFLPDTIWEYLLHHLRHSVFCKDTDSMQSNPCMQSKGVCSKVLRCHSISWRWFNLALKNCSRILEVLDLLNISLDIACTSTLYKHFKASGWKNATSFEYYLPVPRQVL